LATLGIAKGSAGLTCRSLPSENRTFAPHTHARVMLSFKNIPNLFNRAAKLSIFHSLAGCDSNNGAR
jgi:hypothetical protein